MLLALSVFALSFGSTLSVNVGLKYLYRDSTCSTPYQIEITYGGVCILTRSNPSSTVITPILYSNAFPNGTVLVNQYSTGTYPTAQCTGSFQSGSVKNIEHFLLYIYIIKHCIFIINFFFLGFSQLLAYLTMISPPIPPITQNNKLHPSLVCLLLPITAPMLWSSK